MIPSLFRCDRYSNLWLEVYTIGYPDMGESIVTFLKDGNHVLMTVVTDYYKTDDADEVWRILEVNGHPPVDIFVWTHPDEDHSVGIESFLDEFDSNRTTIVYMPANLTMDDIPCEAAKKVYDYLVRNYNVGRKYQLNSILTIEDQVVTLNCFEIQERLTNRKISGKFHFLLPDSSLTIRRSFNEAKNSGDMNDFSIVYVLELNGMHYFFGGDMTQQSIQFVERKDKFYRENIRYVKIPHHGSLEPINIAEKLIPFKRREAVATTTVFKTTHPYEEALDRYSEFCKHISSTDRGSAHFGSIQLNFNITNVQVPTPVYGGNAKMVRH